MFHIFVSRNIYVKKKNEKGSAMFHFYPVCNFGLGTFMSERGSNVSLLL